VQFVKIDNRSRFKDAVIQDRLHVPLGVPLDAAALDKSIEDIYGLGYLDLVRYEVVNEDGQQGVIVHVTQDSRGTRFLEWGIDIFSGDDDTSANVRLALLDTAIDDLGSEARVMIQLGESPAFLAEMYKAVNPDLQLYLRPVAFAEKQKILTFDDDGHQLNEFEVVQFGGQMDVMREFGNSAAVSVGLRMFSGDAQVQIGNPATPDYSYNGGEYLVSAALDTWDDSYFPSRGTRAGLSYVKSSRSINADAAYEQIQARAFQAWSHGRHTLIGGGKYNITLDDDAPIYALYRGGGLFNLSGLQPNQVNGQNFGLALVTYRYDLSGKGGLFPAYAGVSAEYGNAGAHHGDPFDNGIMNGSIFFGNRSPLGPLYWGFAFAEDGERAYFLRIGNVYGQSTIGR
jgi:NTE family protein